MFVTEGNRYNVRGDIAFAQSIVETAWFNYPGLRAGAPDRQQLRRHRRVRLVRHRLPVRERAERRARAAAAAAQLRRHQLARHATSPIPRCPSSGAARRRPPTTTSTTTSPRATRRCGTTWATATGRPRRTTTPSILSVYNQMLTFSGLPGQCPPDGLLFGPLTAAGPCPVSLRQPGRAIAATPCGGIYVLNGDGTVDRVQRRARRSARRRSPLRLVRDIAVMPDGDGLRRAQRQRPGATSSAPPPIPRPLGALGMGYFPGARRRPLDRGHARRQGLPDPPRATAACSSSAARRRARWPRSATRCGRRRRRPLASRSCPTAQGYLVLDNARRGAEVRHARRTGVVGAGIDAVLGRRPRSRHRDRRPASGMAFGYYVLDAWGGVFDTSGLAARTNPSATLFRDRWRGDHDLRREAVAAAQRRHHHADELSRAAAGSAQSTTTERSTSPRSILWNASSTVVERDGLAHEAVEVEAARQVQVDQHREVA